eukprot:scaffold20975_cov75-Phaeocystis_antarctica.AAC.2
MVLTSLEGEHTAHKPMYHVPMFDLDFSLDPENAVACVTHTFTHCQTAKPHSFRETSCGVRGTC